MATVLKVTPAAPTSPPPVAFIDLQLNGNEAAMLEVVLSLISGNPQGRRGLADSVRTALRQAGFSHPPGLRGAGSFVSGSIDFDD